MSGTVRLRLPATSANLGPGFDALGLAMDFHLHVEAEVSGKFAIEATGRNAQVCGDVADSLILSTYQEVLGQQGLSPAALALKVRNEIPLGMGCGSSAAALVAGVALASHFGGLGWSRHEILTEASLREGHPDNVAACVMGGLTVSAMSTEGARTTVSTVSLAPATKWPLLLVMPGASLSTSKARGLLPDSYSRADTVANIQAASLLTAAFATGRGELLALAMRDRVHQPYRSEACALLPLLLPLAGTAGVLGVALSGAGPSILLVLEDRSNLDDVEAQVIRAVAGNEVELFRTKMSGGASL
jgi:homoserine kinase